MLGHRFKDILPERIGSILLPMFPLVTWVIIKNGIILSLILYGLKHVPPRSLSRSLLPPPTTSVTLTGNNYDLQLRINILTALEAATSDNIPDLIDGLEDEFYRIGSWDLGRAWEKATQVYKNANKLSNANRKQYKAAHMNFAENVMHFKELHIALITFVMDKPPFYQEFNNLTRSLRSVEEVKSFPYKNFYKLLLKAMLYLKGEPPSIQSPTGWTLYRGIMRRVKVEVGESIIFQQFISTSRSQHKAEIFAEVGGTVFVIDGLWTGGKLDGGICVDHIAPAIPQRQEWECIVWPYSTFTVTRKEMKEVFLEIDIANPENGNIEFIYLEAIKE